MFPNVEDGINDTYTSLGCFNDMMHVNHLVQGLAHSVNYY